MNHDSGATTSHDFEVGDSYTGVVPHPEPLVIAVAGVAGSGKSTLGRALAKRLTLPLLDLDRLTNPVLDAIPAERLGGHWLAAPDRAAIRDGRYAALRDTAADVVTTGTGAVLVAPFTAELAGGAAFKRLAEALAPARLHVVQVVGAPDLIDMRRRRRDATRDVHRPGDDRTAPAIPVITVDAELTTDQQVARVLIAVGRRQDPLVTGQWIDRTFDAVLFDLDGTLVDSTASVNRSWERLANEFGFAAADLAAFHGRPAAVTVGALVPSDPMRAAVRVQELEEEDAVSVRSMRGALDLLDGLSPGTWAVVTSGSRQIAMARVKAAGLPAPFVFITADDVAEPKPSSEPFLLAAEQLGVPAERCLVLEDAPAGVAAGRSAGCTVVGVAGTVSSDALSGADVIVDGIDRLGLTWTETGYRLLVDGR